MYQQVAGIIRAPWLSWTRIISLQIDSADDALVIDVAGRVRLCVWPDGHNHGHNTEMAEATQTDVSRPSALPTANLAHRTAAPNLGSTRPHLDATEYLDSVQEDLNKRVDNDIDVLVEGMVDLVEMASASNAFFKKK